MDYLSMWATICTRSTATFEWCHGSQIANQDYSCLSRCAPRLIQRSRLLQQRGFRAEENWSQKERMNRTKKNWVEDRKNKPCLVAHMMQRSGRAAAFSAAIFRVAALPADFCGAWNCCCLPSACKRTKNAAKHWKNTNFGKVGWSTHDNAPCVDSAIRCVDPPIFQKLVFFRYFAAFSALSGALCQQRKNRPSQQSWPGNTGKMASMHALLPCILLM